MVTNETLKIIKQRRSVRSYTPQQITDEELQAILEAGQYAPNAGDQAWHFTAVQNPVLLDKLNVAAKEAAKSMRIPDLKALGNNNAFHCLYHAPTLVVVSVDASAPMPLDADCAAATENMLLAAESLGLGCCWIFFVLLAFQSPQAEELRKALKIPEGHKPLSAAVFGCKKADAEKVPQRKPGVVTVLK